MDTSKLLTPTIPAGQQVENRQYFDSSSRCQIVISTPAAHPRLWRSYLDGARICYREHGVEPVLDYGRVLNGDSTSMFFAAVSAQGRVVGGMRAQGPYLSSMQAHALEEWAGRAGSDQLRREIDRRIPAGIIEMKTGWVADDVAHRPALTAALARFFVHSMALLGTRYAMCTVAAHAVGRWQTTGGVVSTTVAPVAYPDERYRTKLMLWDAQNYARLAAAEQLPLLIDEAAQLARPRPANEFSPLAA